MLTFKSPRVFAVTTEAYERFLDDNGLSEQVFNRLKDLDSAKLEETEEASADIRSWIEAGRSRRTWKT